MQATAAVDELGEEGRKALRRAMVALSGEGATPDSVGLSSSKVRLAVGAVTSGDAHPETIGVLTSMLRPADWERADYVIEHAEQVGIAVLSPFDPEYPSALSTIPDPPLALFVQGPLRWCSSPQENAAGCKARRQKGTLGGTPSASIVGSRNPSPYGASVAKSFARTLATAHVTVVSGFARGCDTAAHQGALTAAQQFQTGGSSTRADCPTPGIGVLGSGLLRIYPRENVALAEEFVEYGGCLISEYGLEQGPQRHFFPERNRIISALSDLVIVVEAKEKSGALITARAALEQGKELCAVPGPIVSELSAGPNRLIAEGARVICTPEDLFTAITELTRFTFDRPTKRGSQQRSREAEAHRSGEARMAPDGQSFSIDNLATPRADLEQICRSFEPGKSHTVDELVERTNLPPPRLLAALSELVFRGAIHEIDGCTYSWDQMVDTPEIFEQIRRPGNRQ